MRDRDGSLGSKLIVFPVAQGSYGLPLEWVQGVGESSVEGAGKAGAVEYRGRKLPFLDLAQWFGGQREGKGPTSLLIMGKGDRVAAAGVDGPGKVVSIEVLEEWPSLFRPLVKGMFTGLMAAKDGLVLIVDPEGVMEEVGRRGERITQGGGGE
jgi:chemotaxis signal transduction protein